MRCLYCGKELALFKRLTGGAEFCSDAHRQQYQEEYNQLALSRLLQASPVPDAAPKPAPLQAAYEGASTSLPPGRGAGGLEVLIDPEQPSYTRTEEWPVGAVVQQEAHHSNGAAPASPRLNGAGDEKGSNGHAYSMGPAEQQEPEPPEAAGFLISRPSIAPGPNHLASNDPAEIDLLGNGRPSPPGTGLTLCADPAPGWAAAVGMTAGVALQDHRAIQEQAQELLGMEEREMMRPVPDLVFGLPHTEAPDLEPTNRVLEVSFTPNAPEQNTSLWMETDSAFSGRAPELGDLARLAFVTVGWDEIARKEGIELPETAAVNPPPVEEPVAPEPAAEAEPAHAEEQLQTPDPAPQEEARPEVESSDMESRDVPSPEVPVPPALPPVTEPLRAEQEPPTGAPVPVRSLKPSPLSVRIETLRAERRQTPQPLEIAPAVARVPAVQAAAPPRSEPIPGAVTKPLPLTLHGHAPGRAKPVQVFQSALARVAGVQVPRSTSLPLRPTMVLGKASAKETSAVEVKTESKAEPRVTEARPAEVRPTFRPLPKPEQRNPTIRVQDPRATLKPITAKVVLPEAKVKPEVAPTPEPAPKPEAPSVAKAPELVKPTATVKLPETTPSKNPEPASKNPEPGAAKTTREEETRQAGKGSSKSNRRDRDSKPETLVAFEPPIKEEALLPPPKAVPAPLMAAPLPELDPDIPFLPVENPGFWGRLPVTAKASMAAAVLVLLIAGGIYLNKNSASAPNGPSVVAAGTVLSSGDAGWLTDWAPDPPTSKRQRHIDVMRASQSLSDYRVEIEGQIERKAMGWVYRASNPKNFYVSKVEIVKPGLEPTIQIARFAVIDGVELPRQEIPVQVKVRPDTVYKIRFEAIGDRFTTWIMDQKVDEWTDSRIHSGGVGLYREAEESLSLKGSVNVIPLVVKR
jgi:hypothetical protein